MLPFHDEVELLDRPCVCVFFLNEWQLYYNVFLFFRRKLKQCLSIGQNVTIGYQIHKDTMVKAGSVTKNTYIV